MLNVQQEHQQDFNKRSPEQGCVVAAEVEVNSSRQKTLFLNKLEEVEIGNLETTNSSSFLFLQTTKHSWLDSKPWKTILSLKTDPYWLKKNKSLCSTKMKFGYCDKKIRCSKETSTLLKKS